MICLCRRINQLQKGKAPASHAQRRKRTFKTAAHFQESFPHQCGKFWESFCMNMEREERMNLEEAEALALRIAEDDEMYAVILGIFPLHSSGRNYYILCCTPSGWVFAVLNR